MCYGAAMEDAMIIDSPNEDNYRVVTMERVLYRPSEVAHLFGISRSHLYVLMAAGSIKAVKIGRSTRFTKQQIVDFIENLRELIPTEVDENEEEDEL